MSFNTHSRLCSTIYIDLLAGSSIFDTPALGCKLKVTPMRLAMWMIQELLRKFNTLSLMSPNPYFDSAEVPTKAALETELVHPSRSTTRGYTAAKDQCGHPSASEESRRVSKYTEGKRAIRICSAACGLVWLARADFSHSQLCVRRSRRACFHGTDNPLDSERRAMASL
ncbi:hypothetical protein RF11_14892 [Thelohanellus kitauei]|uniref:Uncharacterized protein n=1 Tax=Thelohanellus kitauei TaxID=669202 RepID=A0A0C2MFJ4_THEKT|nr:hypothetical protein RF11_14892 [Thelohanellus kitauei]